MKNTFLLSLIILLCFLSCKNTTNQQSHTNSTLAKTAHSYPIIDVDILKYLSTESTYIDYIFHYLPISISQGDKETIQSTIMKFSSEPQASIPTGYRPIARLMFHVDGEIVQEFDVYHGELGNFFVQMENEKPAAINKMTSEGIKFYQDITDQALQLPPKY